MMYFKFYFAIKKIEHFFLLGKVFFLMMRLHVNFCKIMLQRIFHLNRILMLMMKINIKQCIAYVKN